MNKKNNCPIYFQKGGKILFYGIAHFEQSGVYYYYCFTFNSKNIFLWTTAKKLTMLSLKMFCSRRFRSSDRSVHKPKFYFPYSINSKNFSLLFWYQKNVYGSITQSNCKYYYVHKIEFLLCKIMSLRTTQTTD